MTRINLVDPALLSPKHLIAEYKELPRIFGLVKKAIERGESPNDKRNPKQYVLGEGHCRFFYKRLGWLVRRQQSLVDECLRRGYNIQHTDPQSLLDGIPDEWVNDYIPIREEIELNIQRINERGGNIKL